MMLRTLLAGLLDAARAAPPLPDRVSANQEALQALCGMIPIIEDPQLVALLVKVLPAAPQLERARSLMAAADRTLQRLEQGDGRLLPQETALAMDLLGVLERIGTTDFLDFCASVTRLSRDPDLVGAARATAAALVSVSVGPRPR